MNKEQRGALEDLVRGPEYQTRPVRDQQVLDALLRQYQENRKPARKLERMKMILHCRSVRAAVVTVTALILIGGLWPDGGNEAWALEKVLTALEQVRTMHVQGTIVYGKASEAKAFRLWVQAPGEDSGPLRMRYECSKLVVILEGEDVYMCRPDKGWALLRHGPDLAYFMPWYDAAELGPWISSKMYKALRQLFADWKESEATDSDTGRKQIIVSCRYVPANIAIRATVDRDTKLIDEARFRLNSPLSKLKLDVDAQAFAYNEDIPSGAFTVPEGMMIIDEAASKEAEALLEKARPLFEAKQYAEVMALYQQVCDEYPGQYNETANARIMIGHCYHALGQQQKALEAYQEAIDIARSTGTEGITMGWYVATGYLSMGRTYVELGQDAKALQAYEACIQACDGWAGPEQWPHKEVLEAIEKLRKP